MGIEVLQQVLQECSDGVDAAMIGMQPEPVTFPGGLGLEEAELQDGDQVPGEPGGPALALECVFGLLGELEAIGLRVPVGQRQDVALDSA